MTFYIPQLRRHSDVLHKATHHFLPLSVLEKIQEELQLRFRHTRSLTLFLQFSGQQISLL
jgi:hypothetical protein